MIRTEGVFPWQTSMFSGWYLNLESKQTRCNLSANAIYGAWFSVTVLLKSKYEYDVLVAVSALHATVKSTSAIGATVDLLRA